jgi:hypothetical protein
MFVSAISFSSPLNQASSVQNANQQQKTAFQQLTQALQSGDLTIAQQAFSALTNSATNSGLRSAQLTQELGKLGSALQSGNLAGAKQAYSTTQQNLQSSNPLATHHHRAHHGRPQLLTSGFPDSTSSSGGDASKTDAFQPLSLSA